MPKQYIADNLVKEARDAGFQTPLGYPVLEVEYESGDTELLTKKYFDNIVTDEPSDATSARDRLVPKVVGEILAIMAEWGVRYIDMNHISDKVAMSHNANQEEALEILYGVPDHKRNMMHVHKVLMSKNAKQQTQSGEDNSTGDDSSAQE